MTNNEAPAVHPFERSGLGLAPFRLVGKVQQDLCYGQAILNRAEYEKTGISLTTKPGGTCAHCGTAILHMYDIESADGRRFHVGSDCVRKTADAKLIRAVDAAQKAATKAKKVAAEKIAGIELSAALADPDVRDRLAAKPHPTAWLAAQGRTLLDWAEFVLDRGGASGVKRALAAVKAA